MNIENYYLIGIGEFSHGIQESWDFRFNLLKKVIKTTNKKITIFTDSSIWQTNNIMNKTFYDKKTNQYVKTTKIKIEKAIHNNFTNQAFCKLFQYVNHTTESKIYLQIIKYIQKHLDRINLIGVDNDSLTRDYNMYTKIYDNLNKTHINFFWAHNAHIDNRVFNVDNLKYSQNTFSNLKYYCGHYLKEAYGKKYCIILSQAYCGINRFNSLCSSLVCSNKTWTLKYFYKPFFYKPNKMYVNNDKKFQLFDKFFNPLIEFSNSYYKSNKYGYKHLVYLSNYDFILFFNRVNELEPYYEYK